MILSNRQTMSTDGILESLGEFYVGVSQNGNKLKLAPNEAMRIEVTGGERSIARTMNVYNGNVRSDNSIMWKLNTNGRNYTFTQNAGNPIDSAFFKTIMYSDSINWLNLDRLFGEPRITYTVNKGNAPDHNSTMVYVHFTGRKSVVEYNAASANQMVALPVTLVGLSVHNNQLYSSFVPVTLNDNGVTTLNFSPTNEKDFKEKLRLLK